MSILVNANRLDTPQTNDKSGRFDDLLVFGYHCKLFRDDEKALAIDAGEHLIPWMGDQSLTIDRYDGRGHLYDLTHYDADTMDRTEHVMTELEQRIEAQCEEERYLELHIDLAEKAIQEEEELKRLNQELAEDAGYQAVGFSYDQQLGSRSDSYTGYITSANSTRQEDDTVEDGVFVPPPELGLVPSMVYPKSLKQNSVIEKTAKFVAQQGGQMEIMIKTKQANNALFAFLAFENEYNPYYKHMVYMIKCGRYNPDVHNRIAAKKGTETDTSDEDDDQGGYLHPSLMSSKSTTQTAKAAVSFPALSASQLEETPYGKLIKQIGPVVTSMMAASTNRGYDAAEVTDSYKEQPEFEHTQYEQAQYDQYYADPSYLATPETNSVEAFYAEMGDHHDAQLVFDYQHSHQEPRTNSHERPPSPPPEMKPLMDRLITYILKDGDEFELQVRDRKDPRFAFLNPTDEHHSYYMWRKNHALKQPKRSMAKSISFSIRQRECESSWIDTSRAALPVDPDSEEEAAGDAPKFHMSPKQEVRTYTPPVEPEKPFVPEDELQRKLAEQKLKDKLAAAAREKMSQVTRDSREKLLQTERKRKAAMFVNMLRNKSVRSNAIGPELPSGEHTPEYSNSPATAYDEYRASPIRQTHSQCTSTREPDASSGMPDTRHNSDSKHRDSNSSRSSRHSHHRSSSRSTHSHRHSERRSGHARHRRISKSDDRRSRHGADRTKSPSVEVHRKRRGSDEITASYTAQNKSSRKENKQGTDVSSESTPEIVSSRFAQPNHGFSSGSSTPSAPDMNKAKTDTMMLQKVRKMLKESRQTVYKEDLFGN